MPKSAGYGSWSSPITSTLISKHSTFLKLAFEIQVDGPFVYWSEIRPTEKGRVVIRRLSTSGEIEDILPEPFGARTLVHEYGTAAYLAAGGAVYFSNFSDQRVYRETPGLTPSPITPIVGDVRYADFDLDEKRHRLICIREDHRDSSKKQAVNELVAIDIEGRREPEVLLTGNDFYTYPRVSPDGTQLAWVTWNNPGLPFFGCELRVGNLTSKGVVENERLVTGGVDESVTQPSWSKDGSLYFVSDRTGWWNLYRWNENKLQLLHRAEAEFAEPPWAMRSSNYAFGPNGTILCAYFLNTIWRLGLLDIGSGKLKTLDFPYIGGSYICSDDKYAYFVAATTTEPDSIIRFDFASERSEKLYSPLKLELDSGYLSTPEVVDYPTSNGKSAHAIYYAPKNKDYIGKPGELPPLLVFAHGGPTGERSVSFDLDKQYWTSRGFAYLDVNYGGSCGYGREYRTRLDGQWGVVDVDDCMNGALYLAKMGKVDPKRMAIKGGSAGGYTVMASAAFRKGVYSAAASHFGLSDLERMNLETHKFERYYNDRLVGPYPEKRDLYIERSPLYSADKISTPIIIFQGLEDKVVPRDQAELIVEALRKNKVPFAYVGFEGEGHGFRKAANRKKAHDGELYFYSKIFGFDLADQVEPVEIENMGVRS
jgi:dipeptidyl aminopeptidase/acylaminoacyl peptidase